jgi:hypothetical protein
LDWTHPFKGNRKKIYLWNLILTVKWSPRIVVVLANKVIVYTFSLEPKKLHVFETIDNDRGKGHFPEN